jgi:hypothetical protein
MGEPKPPRNEDQEVPTKSGEEIGEREPPWPDGPEKQRPNSPLPEEETYERGRNDP